VLGILSIIFALILLFNPFLATLAVPWVLGLLGIVGGIIAIFGAFGLRRLQKESAMQAQVAVAPAMQTRVGVVAPAPVTPALPVEPVEAEPAVLSGVAMGTVAAAVAVDSATSEPEASFSVVAETPPAEPEPAQVAPAVPQAEPPAGFGGGKFEEDIEYVEGIGPAFGQKLKAMSIFTPKDLLERGAAPKGREEIAEGAGISGKLVLVWVNHCDLFRIKGVGSEYADLLEAAGVDTVVELATRNPANLYVRILDVNAEKSLVRRVPVQSQVEDWVAQAKLLPRVITY
jgi:predicted flap endonuclease-1-like 5' DNA nuclease